MELLHKTGSNFIRGTRAPRLSRPLLLIILLLAATLSIACNPFGDEPDPLSGEEAGGESSEALTEKPSKELAEVGLERILAATEQNGTADTADNEVPTAELDPSPTPTEIPIPAATAMSSADEARNQVWAYLSQCVSINVNDLEARQVQGEWFVQAAGKSPDQYGLWKVDPIQGLVRPHNIRARQWEPLVNQTCTPGQLSGFFAPTPSPLRDSDVTEATHAVTTLWATLVNCYPNMETGDLQATLNPAKGEWVVTSKTDVSADYGVWAVASDGTVSPKNRQAQGVFDQLDSGLC